MPDVFAAIADPTRREILERLRTEGGLSVSDLSDPLPISRQAVTKHLDALQEAGLVARERIGRERIHRLNADPLRELDDWLAPYSAAWDRRLQRLSDYLAKESSDDGRD